MKPSKKNLKLSKNKKLFLLYFLIILIILSIILPLTLLSHNSQTPPTPTSGNLNYQSQISSENPDIPSNLPQELKKSPGFPFYEKSGPNQEISYIDSNSLQNTEILLYYKTLGDLQVNKAHLKFISFAPNMEKQFSSIKNKEIPHGNPTVINNKLYSNFGKEKFFKYNKTKEYPNYITFKLPLYYFFQFFLIYKDRPSTTPSSSNKNTFNINKSQTPLSNQNISSKIQLKGNFQIIFDPLLQSFLFKSTSASQQNLDNEENYGIETTPQHIETKTFENITINHFYQYDFSKDGGKTNGKKFTDYFPDQNENIPLQLIEDHNDPGLRRINFPPNPFLESYKHRSPLTLIGSPFEYYLQTNSPDFTSFFQKQNFSFGKDIDMRDSFTLRYKFTSFFVGAEAQKYPSSPPFKISPHDNLNNPQFNKTSQLFKDLNNRVVYNKTHEKDKKSLTLKTITVDSDYFSGIGHGEAINVQFFQMEFASYFVSDYKFADEPKEPQTSSLSYQGDVFHSSQYNNNFDFSIKLLDKSQLEGNNQQLGNQEIFLSSDNEASKTLRLKMISMFTNKNTIYISFSGKGYISNQHYFLILSKLGEGITTFSYNLNLSFYPQQKAPPSTTSSDPPINLRLGNKDSKNHKILSSLETPDLIHGFMNLNTILNQDKFGFAKYLQESGITHQNPDALINQGTFKATLYKSSKDKQYHLTLLTKPKFSYNQDILKSTTLIITLLTLLFILPFLSPLVFISKKIITSSNHQTSTY